LRSAEDRGWEEAGGRVTVDDGDRTVHVPLEPATSGCVELPDLGLALVLVIVMIRNLEWGQRLHIWSHHEGREPRRRGGDKRRKMGYFGPYSFRNTPKWYVLKS
jgi:hypothetical protein